VRQAHATKQKRQVRVIAPLCSDEVIQTTCKVKWATFLYCHSNCYLLL